MPRSRPDDLYLDTPLGIVTTEGVRFQTTEALLRDYAGPVLDRVPLPVHIRRALVWLDLGRTVALCVLLPLLVYTHPLVAVAVTLLVYVGTEVLAPASPSVPMADVVRWIRMPWLIGLPYVFVLSMLGYQEQLIAVLVGLLGFVALRLGAVAALARPAVRALQQRLYSLPVPDQVLRGFITRTAIKYGIPLANTADMEEQVQAFWRRKKR
ncbi:MAG: hypothetical protein AAF809_10515 [Bacteroidota bacterium]